MILVCGIPSESPLKMVTDSLDRLSVPYTLFNQLTFEKNALELALLSGKMEGTMRIGKKKFRLSDVTGVLLRLMDHTSLPSIEEAPQGSLIRQHGYTIHNLFYRWCNNSDARILNPPDAMSSNGSKPYQAQLIVKEGFRTPRTLITNDPEKVRAFYKKHKQVIYKSISGIRSIVQPLKDEDLENIQKIRSCPTQFQAYVQGYDVRVHVVGEKTFATKVNSGAVDYRYANQQTGVVAELEAVGLIDDLHEKCVKLSKRLNLPFAGIDLRITPKGEVYCFEVNPCPAFSYYESHTQQPIADAVARHLAGE